MVCLYMPCFGVIFLLVVDDGDRIEFSTQLLLVLHVDDSL